MVGDFLAEPGWEICGLIESLPRWRTARAEPAGADPAVLADTWAGALPDAAVEDSAPVRLSDNAVAASAAYHRTGT